MFHRRVCRTCIFFCVGALSLTMAWGCGQSSGQAKFPSVRLEGAVTVDGKPIEEGTIQFVPSDKSAGGVTQAVILQGRYVAPRVPLGKVTAMLFAAQPPPPSPETITTDYQPVKVLTIPDRYKNGFPIEVKEDKSDVDFAMTSK